MKRIMIIPDSMKGTFSSKEMIQNIVSEIRGRFEYVAFPFSDGGEGALDALIFRYHCPKIIVKTKDLYENEKECYYCIVQDTAYIELAQIVGLTEKKNPMRATSYGVGNVFFDAYKKGIRKFVFFLGGTGINDGGAGFLCSLGTKFYDEKGHEIFPYLENFPRIKNINTIVTKEFLRDIQIDLYTDCKNPLIGKEGATYFYGYQKGIQKDSMEMMDTWIKEYAYKIGILPDILGLGAAGGFGCSVIPFGAKIQSGAVQMLHTCGFYQWIDLVDAVITSEGCVDEQSFHGKAVGTIYQECMVHHKPVYVLCGCLKEEIENSTQLSFYPVHRSSNEDFMEHKEEDLRKKIQELLETLDTQLNHL